MKKIYRILDANINRTFEGFRVIEEYFRFYEISNDKQKQLKELRHSLIDIIKQIDYNERLKNRNSNDDIGSKYSLSSEKKKNNIIDILISNFKRIQESLRCLEEYSKLLNEQISINFKNIRFKVYNLEKRIMLQNDEKK